MDVIRFDNIDFLVSFKKKYSHNINLISKVKI